MPRGARRQPMDRWRGQPCPSPSAFLARLACCLLLASLPLVILDPYLIHLLNIIGIYCILVMGMNFLIGYTGQFSLGQAGFYGIGAYTSALLSLKFPLTFWLTLPAAGLVAALSALIVAPVLRLREYVLALVTLAFGEIIRLILLNWESLTKGPSGITNIPPPSVAGFEFSNGHRYYYIILASCLLTYLILHRIVHSSSGRALRAIRDNQEAAEASGVPVARLKILAFVLAGFFTGVAGSLYAHLISYVSPSSFQMEESFKIFVMVVVGGVGSLVGSVMGATLLTLIPEYLRLLAEYNLILYGLVLLAMMIFAPRGLYGLCQDGWKALTARWAQPHPGPAPVPAEPEPKGETATPGQRRIEMPLPNPKELLEVRQVSKRFGGLSALSGIDLSVAPGEIRGLIGPNGAGKTTLFNIVAGIYLPTSGQVLLHGEVITGLRPHRIACLGLARTFQQVQLFHGLTVLEHVMVGTYGLERQGLLAAILKSRKGRREEEGSRERARTILDELGLLDKGGKLAGHLPFGQQRLLELGRALAMEPALLLLDEPSSGMNPQETAGLRHILIRLNRQGLTIVMVEHDMKMVMGICHRVTVLDFGEKIAEGEADVIQRDERVIRAYLGTNLDVDLK